MSSARTAIVIAVSLALGLVVVPACGSPHDGKAQKLRMPSVRDGDDPDDPDTPPPAGGAPWNNKCRTNFFDTPTKQRNGKEGKRLATQAGNQLERAETEGGQVRVETIKDSIGTLRQSLKKDPYGPEATYKMAIAYTLLWQKKCALLLLDRLAQLEGHPKVWKEASRVIERALRDPAFDPFRKEADRALGR